MPKKLYFSFLWMMVMYSMSTILLSKTYHLNERAIILSSDNSSIPDRPNPPRLYNNFSKEFPNFLSPAESEDIEQKLEAFSRETSNQIAVVIVDDFAGYTASEYATMIGEKWGLGKKDKDNGVLILIKPTGKAGEREIFIAVGLGLEGAITDLATKKIIDNIMKPLFAEERYYDGLNKGLDALMKLAKGEINEKDLPQEKNNQIIWIFLLVFLMILLFGKKSGRVVYTSGRGYRSSRRFYSGGWGSFGGGSSSGGGWSGFGGGSFGGGGAGGKW